MQNLSALRVLLVRYMAAMLLLLPTFASADFEASVRISASQPGAQIHRNIYGQFSEHLGAGIYDGVWVGEDSPIANTRGIRQDVVSALKQLRVPVIRWPGGCFADVYHWRDGIGPRAERPVRINSFWGGVEESNAFGTHEFFDFAEQIGAQPYLAANVGSGSPKELADWLEYISSDTQSTLAEERRHNGRKEPWKLPYVGVGNETWGCGGNMRPEFSADLYRQFATYVFNHGGQRPLRIASGANGTDFRWTEVLMVKAGAHMDAFSLHHYTLPTNDWSKKGQATGFGEAEWAAQLKHTLYMDELVSKHRAIMDRHDPEGRVGLWVDEWGAWYDPPAEGVVPPLYQQNTLRDALVAALSLHIFHRHAKRVHMSGIAQTVNVLQAMILTDGPRMLLTPTYHVFEMQVPFQDSTHLPATVDTPEYRFGETAMPAVDASAARTTDGAIVVSLVNSDARRAAKLTLDLEGARIASAEGRVLSADALDAHNTFDEPARLQPVALDGMTLLREGQQLSLELPAAAVAVILLRE